tara:strand:+ start:3285 stop:3527 length:243 start_codon:yes stop_codon:yes gene_type:complete
LKSRKIYNELKDIFDRIGYKIILDNGNFNSGYCILEEEKVIVINKNKPYENRVRTLSEILSSIELDNIYIKPYIREFISQ